MNAVEENARNDRVNRINRLLVGTGNTLIHPLEDATPHLYSSSDEYTTPSLPDGIVGALDVLPDTTVAPFITSILTALGTEGRKAFEHGLAVGRQRQLQEFHEMLGITALRAAIRDGLENLATELSQHP